MVVGIGCRKNVSSGEIVAAINAALAQTRMARERLDALASVPLKQGEAALKEAADELGLPLMFPAEEALQAASPHAQTRSAASLAATGTVSASECAALAAAGPGARLVGPRAVFGNVTCAVAVSEEPA